MRAPVGGGMEQSYIPSTQATVQRSAAYSPAFLADDARKVFRMRHRPVVLGRPSSRSENPFQIAARDVNSLIQHLADTIFIVLLGAVVAAAYHFGVHGMIRSWASDVAAGIVVAFAFAATSRMTFHQRGMVVTRSYERLRDAALSWTLAFGILTFGLFTIKAGAMASRGSVLALYGIGLPLIMLWRVFVPVALAPLARRVGSAMRECIVIGEQADSLADKFVTELKESGHPAAPLFKFRAFCPVNQWQGELDRLVSEVTSAAHRSGPGEVYLCAGNIPADRLAAIMRRLTVLPRAIYVVPDAQTASLIRSRPATVGRFVAMEARREPLGRAQRILKRSMDIFFSGVALAGLSPLLVMTAIAIKLDSKGPVLFRQTRNGYRGQPFKILKFRSMHVQEDGPVIRQASRNDARVTRVGRFIRKMSIDELPQLVNILLGDMSLVGPRPHAQAHDELYARTIENYEIRQHVKPGLTGWAQVNGLRGETSTIDAMYQRIEYDLWYAVNASVLLDIEIMVRTAFEVVRTRNAY